MLNEENFVKSHCRPFKPSLLLVFFKNDLSFLSFRCLKKITFLYLLWPSQKDCKVSSLSLNRVLIANFCKQSSRSPCWIEAVAELQTEPLSKTAEKVWLGVGVGWARPKNFRALPSPNQTRKIRVGLLAYGPKILICNKKTSKIGSFFVSEENIFHLIEIFQNMPKLMMKLRPGNLPPNIFFLFLYVGQPMSWARLSWAFLILAQPSPSQKIPAHAGLIENSWRHAHQTGNIVSTLGGTDGSRLCSMTCYLLNRTDKALQLTLQGARTHSVVKWGVPHPAKGNLRPRDTTPNKI